jgi:hypothetical protein
MSVVTTADEKIKNAKALMSEAFKELLVVLDDETWGHSNFSNEYLEEVLKVSAKLLKLKNKL